MRRAMRHFKALFFVGLLGFFAMTLAKSGEGETKPVRVALVKMPYVGERNVPDTSRGPDYMEEGGIRKLLEQQGAQVKATDTVALTADEEKAYGQWNHLALAAGDMGRRVADERRGDICQLDCWRTATDSWACSAGCSIRGQRRSRCAWEWCSLMRTAISIRRRPH